MTYYYKKTNKKKNNYQGSLETRGGKIIKMWTRNFDLFSFGLFRGKTIEMRRRWRRRENNKIVEKEEGNKNEKGEG